MSQSRQIADTSLAHDTWRHTCLGSSRAAFRTDAPVIPPKVPTPGPEAPVEEAADSLPEPVPFVRPNDEERVAADVDEVGGRVAVDE